MQFSGHKVLISQIDVRDHRLRQVSVEPLDESQNKYLLMTYHNSKSLGNLSADLFHNIDYPHQYF